MRIVVTGGAGFIGSHIVESLVADGHDVCVFDNLSTGNLENLSNVQSRISFVRGDILDLNLLQKSMEGADVVSHQAAQLEIFKASDDPLYDLTANTVGTLNVLKAAKEVGVKKVLNASSACVYGQHEGASVESQSLRPNWAYGVSKLAAENYGHLFNDYYGVPVVSLRYGIVYGEREWFRRVLTIFIRRAIEKRPLVVFGSGEQKRDFICVDDVVSLHRTCLYDPRADGNAFNAGSGTAISVSDLATLVAEVSFRESGFRPEILNENVSQGAYSALVTYKRRNTAELQSMWLSTEKANKTLGWAPKTALSDGITREFKWAESNMSHWVETHRSHVKHSNHEASKILVV